MSDKEKYMKTHYEDFERLWSDPHIQNVMQYQHMFYLAETVLFLADKMDDYWRDEFRLESELEVSYLGHEIWEVFDVGGARNERRKWMHFFDNTSCVFFCAALSGYNECLWPHDPNSKNKLKEAIGLFRAVVNLDTFRDTPIIILLTKYDQFVEKIGKYAFSEYFKGFSGRGSESEVIEYVKQYFIRQIRTDENGQRRRIYFHTGSVIDTSWVRVTFDSCRQIISSV
eukprot:20035_1